MDNQTNYVLLTGAGFTANIGTPLGYQMWERIHCRPEINSSPALKAYICDHYRDNYEILYHQIIKDPQVHSDDKASFLKALSEAYREIDDYIKRWNERPDQPYPFNRFALEKLLKRFAEKGKPGLFFTLNQDLFIERHSSSSLNLYCPGLGDTYNCREENCHRKDFSAILPQQFDNHEIQQSFNTDKLLYIKLHGSTGWRSSDGSEKLVIGLDVDKEKQIIEEPLLREYQNIFVKSISRGNTRILVIGYGFREEYLNKLLFDAIPTGLEFVIIDRASKNDLLGPLGDFRCKEILRATRKYYNLSFASLLAGAGGVEDLPGLFSAFFS